MFFVTACFCSCATIAENAGRLLDGSALAEKKLATYKSGDGSIIINKIRQKDGTELLQVALNYFPSLKIYTELPDARGNFSLVRLHFLCAGNYGWNEFEVPLSGYGRFIVNDDDGSAVFSLDAETIDRMPVSGGKILYQQRRSSGEDALRQLVNRENRIAAIVEFMLEAEAMQTFGVVSDSSRSNAKDFGKFWTALFFPETVKKKLRPAVYNTLLKTEEEQAASNGKKHKSIDGIRWNTTYTALYFPAELQALRDTGTMLRDFEEALPWIFTEYCYAVGIGFPAGVTKLTLTKKYKQ
jgi:hypothetical protein